MVRRLIAPDQLPSKGITLGNDRRCDLEAEGRFPDASASRREPTRILKPKLTWLEAKIAARDADTPEAE